MSTATVATIDWRRVSKGLCDAVRNNGGGDVDRAIELVQGILSWAGPASQTSKMARRLGLLCLHGKPNVIVPACPDLPHNGQVYTFRGELGSDVSLLALRHINFLCLIQRFLGEIIILYADREALDPYLQRICRADQSAFMERLRGSVEATRRSVADRSLSAGVMMMSELFPCLGDQEEASIQHLLATEMHQLRSMTISRMDMYARMGISQRNHDEMILRTARTAAQYSALGTLAAQQNLAVVNHTTVNLRRFTEVGTALIHNPVKVY